MTVERLRLPAHDIVEPIQPHVGAPGVPDSVDPPQSLRRRHVVVAGATPTTTIVEALAAALAAEAGLEVLSTATNETDLFELIAYRRPHVVVLYAPELDPDAMKIVDRLKMLDPGVRIVVLSAQPSLDALTFAASAGVAACLSLDARLHDLAEAIRADTTDTMLVNARSLSSWARARRNEEPGATAPALTRREREVLTMLADGCSPPVIAAQLVVSIYTARGHVKNVLRKLGVHSQLEAVAAARKAGLLSPGESPTASAEADTRTGAGRRGQLTPIVRPNDHRLLERRRNG